MSDGDGMHRNADEGGIISLSRHVLSSSVTPPNASIDVWKTMGLSLRDRPGEKLIENRKSRDSKSLAVCY